MIKDLFLAITLGALLGFGATGGFFALNKSKNNPNTTNRITPTIINTSVSTDTQVIPTITSENIITSGLLTIDSPKDKSIVSNSKVNIKGTAPAKSIIIINTLSRTFTFLANDSGRFEGDIELDSGANIVNVSAVDSQDNQSETQILVTYSTAKI